MGLDIRAYSKLELIETLLDMEDWEEKYYPPADGLETVYISACYFDDWAFSEWARGLEPGGVYRVSGDIYSFRAGSYSGYNDWREWLCRTIHGIKPKRVWDNFALYESIPFYRLIHFSDCEGYIGIEFAKDLAADFAMYQDKIDALDCHIWYKEKYADWRKAFELAADNGVVDFH